MTLKTPKLRGNGEVPDSARSFLFLIYEYIQIHYIYYQIQLQTIVNFLVLFLDTKNGEITTDECAVLLKMELKKKKFFLIPYPNLQKNCLVNEIFERKKR